MRLPFPLQLALLLLTTTIFPTLHAAELEISTTHSIPAHLCPFKASPGDTVKVHYLGTLSTGTKFDASYDRGQPLTFQLGAGRVIKGWDQGLEGMCVGEKRRLVIPPELGYGERAMGPIPAGSTLIFETELVGIVGKPDEGRGKEETKREPERDEL